jgi:hypothetical protein
MPDKETMRRAKRDKTQGKAAGTQAGEFVREEMDHIRQGKHGARSSKQAIAIGLSKARRAGVDLPAPKKGSRKVKRQARRDLEKGRHPSQGVSAKRSHATTGALKRESRKSASHKALSRHARAAAAKRGPSERRKSSQKAAHTRAYESGMALFNPLLI